MEPFFVLPSESLLIGLCLGRYLQYEGREGHTFPCVVQSWVQPFVPPTWPLLTYPYEEKDFEEIEHDFGDLMRNNECNETFDLGREFGRALAICEDYAARLADLDDRRICELAREGKHPGWLPSPEDDLRFVEKYYRGKTAIEPDVDAANDIEESAFQPALDFLLPRDELEVYATVLEGVIASRLVQRSMYARQCLADCTLPVMVAYHSSWKDATAICRLPDHYPILVGAGGDTIFKSQQYFATEHANRSRAMLWLAFGELLGFLRDVDSLAKTAEWTSAAPRSFRELFDASGDKVRNAIRDAESVLSTDTSEDAAAKAVGTVANGIEALARRIWSIRSSRSQKSRSPLMEELISKRQSGTEDEQRFASIAITLYKSYRNPVAHDFDKFQCSITEAGFFVVGMRTLLELSDRILATGKGGKQA
jgi:hypothetical protein